jgi:hypothetical protein
MDAYQAVRDGWREQVKQLVPTIHGHQKKSLALCALGVILAGSVVVQRVARSASACPGSIRRRCQVSNGDWCACWPTNVLS